MGKRISQRHLEDATQDVLSAKSIMQQSLFSEDAVTAADPASVLSNLQSRWRLAIIAALGLAGIALVASLGALGLLFLR